MENKVNDCIDKVATKDDFILFMKLLKEDFLMNKAQWENTNIEHFLDAISAWVEDANLDDFSQESRKIDWQFMANVFYAGKVYE